MRYRGGLDRIIGTGIDRHVRAIGIIPNTASICRLTEGIGPDTTSVCALITRFNRHPGAKVIAPTLAGLFTVVETTRCSRTTCQSIGYAMTIFVHNDAVIEISIARRTGLRPHIHLHAGIAAIRRCGEIGIVQTATILRLGKNRVTAGSAITKIVFLKITAGLVKAVLMKHVMNQVIPVEKIRDSRILILAGILVEIDREREIQARITGA